MDLHSLHITVAVYLGLCLYLLLIQSSSPGLSGLRWITIGFSSAALGTQLIGLGATPAFIHIVLANLFILLIHGFLGLSIADMLQRKSRLFQWLLWLSYLPILVLFPVYTYVHPNIFQRILIYSVIAVLQNILLTIFVLGPGPARLRLPRIGLAVVFLLWTGGNAYRFWRIAQSAHAPKRFVDNVSSTLLSFSILHAVMLALGFVWLAMARLQLQLELQSRTDALTGLLNRHALDEIGTRCVTRARNLGSPLSLIILDLDHFKLVNDHHGHDAGDAALTHTARCLRDILNGTPQNELLIARIGGEEFVAFLPDTPPRRATEIAELLRGAIAASTVPDLQPEIRLSASLGVTALTPTDLTWQEVLQRADKALYQAKQEGRNRVMAA